jgi:hypothetical protein
MMSAASWPDLPFGKPLGRSSWAETCAMPLAINGLRPSGFGELDRGEDRPQTNGFGPKKTGAGTPPGGKSFGRANFDIVHRIRGFENLGPCLTA